MIPFWRSESLSKKQHAGAPRERFTMSKLEATLAIQIRAAGLPEPAAEYRFAPPRRFRFDFAWPDRRIAVEVEGGTWTNGRHTRAAGYEKDTEKYNLAATEGWLVIRCTGDMVRDGRALDWIEKAWRSRSALVTILRRKADFNPAVVPALEELFAEAAELYRNGKL